MRNLLEYPVTPQEIADCCRKVAAEDTDVLGCGNMTPLLLSMAADVVEAAAGVVEGINERLDTRDIPLKWFTPWDRATALVNAFKAVKDPPT
jgi:hypothetical protein